MASLQATRPQSQEPPQQEKQKIPSSTISTEEIGKYRATAQQNSDDALRAAEERYGKARDYVTEKAREAAHKAREVSVTAGKTVADFLQEKAEEVKERAAGGMQRQMVYGTEKGRDWRKELGVGEGSTEGQWGGEEEEEGVVGRGCLRKEHIGLRPGETMDTSWEEEPYLEKGTEETRRTRRGSSLEGRGGGEVEEMEDEGYMAGFGEGPTMAGGGGLLEAVEEVVMGIAQTARDLLMGRQ